MRIDRTDTLRIAGLKVNPREKGSAPGGHTSHAPYQRSTPYESGGSITSLGWGGEGWFFARSLGSCPSRVLCGVVLVVCLCVRPVFLRIPVCRVNPYQCATPYESGGSITSLKRRETAHRKKKNTALTLRTRKQYSTHLTRLLHRGAC